MGAIQGSIDKLVSTATAVAAVGKHFKEIEDAKKLEAAETRVKVGEEIPKIKEEMDASKKQMQSIDKEVQKQQKIIDNPQANKKKKDAALKKMGELTSDMKMARVAMQTTTEKIEARRMLLERANKILSKGGNK